MSPARFGRRSELDLRTQLDDPVRRKSEEECRWSGVSLHHPEDLLSPARHSRSPGGDEGLTPQGLPFIAWPSARRSSA